MNILVLGKNGMAGSMIFRHLSIEEHNIVALGREEFDPLKDQLPPDINKKFDYIINCIGIIKQKSNDKELLFKLNSNFPKQLCEQHNKVIHISSDCVFSGKINKNKLYYTNDKTDAEDDYGQSKADGEALDKCLVLRTSIIGPAKDNFGLFEWFKNTTDNPIKGFTNHLWSGITTLELAKIINNIIVNDTYQHGLKQIASHQITKYDLLRTINNVYKLNKQINPVIAKDSINRTLSPDIKTKTILEQLQELRDFE
jgi:dTDP-4-dehydrorhamnose reductase